MCSDQSDKVWFDSAEKMSHPLTTKGTKLCPFRTTKDGEFAPCYGSECMAYYELDMPMYYCGEYTSSQTSTHISGCRNFNLSVPYGCNNPA